MVDGDKSLALGEVDNHQMFSEFVATFGLLSVIWGCARLRSQAVPFAVAAYITAAYWFTTSTSFAFTLLLCDPRGLRYRGLRGRLGPIKIALLK